MSRTRKTKDSDTAEKENNSNVNLQPAGSKRKSFQAFFSKEEDAKPKVRKLIENLNLSDFKTLLSKSIEEQKQEKLVLLLTNSEKLRSTEVTGKTLNFGMRDINGITIEAVVFGNSDQLRLKSIVNSTSATDDVIMFQGWTWFINNSTFISSNMIQDKINVGSRTEISFASTTDLVTSCLKVFKLCDSLERLIVGRCFNIHETAWFVVAKRPKFFYQTYSGVLISDGEFFGIVAVEMSASGGLKTKFEFNPDTVFKIKNVNAKIFDVAHRNIGELELSYLQLNNVQKPCIFYVDEKTDIVEGEYDDIVFAKELNDIKYPEQAEEVPKTPLSELIKSLKPK
uniref:Uncharacterized protein n=1 Tax=Panagrolaimus superbus TaxID=310955 RepID=A0A914YFG4_9BILA